MKVYVARTENYICNEFKAFDSFNKARKYLEEERRSYTRSYEPEITRKEIESYLENKKDTKNNYYYQYYDGANTFIYAIEILDVE